MNKVSCPSDIVIRNSANLYAPWQCNEEFARAFRIVHGNTMSGPLRNWGIWEALSQLRNTPGDLLELGTCKGGAGVLMALAARQFGFQNCHTYLLDSFAGVCKNDPDLDPSYKGGEHAVGREYVDALIKQVNGEAEITVVPGIFPDENASVIKDKSFRFIHYDCDTYQAAKDSTKMFLTNMPIGGIIIYDDYGRPNVLGVRKAVHELVEEYKDVVRLVYNLNTQATLIKIR